MRKTIWKYFWIWDFEKEEQWINEMGEKGLHLVKVDFCRYTFEEGEPGIYEYLMELMEDSPDSCRGKEYAEIYEEAGLKQVGTFDKWVYWRKEKGEDGFILFSDLDSRIVHLARIVKVTYSAVALVIFAGILNLFVYILCSGYKEDVLHLALSIGLLVAGYIGFLGGKRLKDKLDRMKKNRILHE